MASREDRIPRPRVDQFSGEPSAHHASLRTPFATKLLCEDGHNAPPPPVLGNPALSTTKSHGKQHGHNQKDISTVGDGGAHS